MTGEQLDDVDGALLQAGEKLLRGWGYTWYRDNNLMRADDMLLRNQADLLLGDALAAFRRAESVFRQKHAGPPNRLVPPEPERMDELRAFERMLDELEALRATLRGAAIPADDTAIGRNRDEADLLLQLGKCDAQLAASAQALRQEALAITPAGLAAIPGLIAPRLRVLRALLAQRMGLLNIS